jgi:hypothetical protein
LKQVKS